MNKISKTAFCILFVTCFFNLAVSQTIPSARTRGMMVLANKYFTDKWPEAGKPVSTDEERPGNTWTRAVYYEGLMALYSIIPDPSFLNTMLQWGEFHKWNMYEGVTTRNAENQCCAQTYIDLYMLDRYKEERIKEIRACIDGMVKTDKVDDWSRIDALQMAMPVFARLGSIYHNESYFDRMHQMYMHTKLKHGTTGLYNSEEHLWWGDRDFVPPYKEPNGANCYWSRGNGMVAAALVRTLQFLPEKIKYRKEYVTTLEEMFEALVPLQGADGFWNVSLKDSTHFGGRETTGTALFTYSMAWSINNGLISKKDYLPVVMKAWNALITESVHNNGFIGYVQGTGKEPKDGQPVGYDIAPDFEDFGLGCFLLAGTEVYKMTKAMEPVVKPPKPEKENVKAKKAN